MIASLDAIDKDTHAHRAVLSGLLQRKERRCHMPVMTTVTELAAQMHKDPAQLYRWAKREVDPMPVRYVDGERYGCLIVSEFTEWFARNSELMSERSGNGKK